jgi:hypothetical protein
MPLDTKQTTIQEAIDDLQTRIEEIGDTMRDLDASSNRYAALEDQASQLEYQASGLVWMRDEAGWGDDAVLELGGLTAGEQARMHKHAPADTVEDEMRLWFVAAGTVAAPYAGETLSETFAELVDTHAGYISWAEAQLNDLATPGNESPRLATYLSETQGSPTSTSDSTSTTSSSSDSPTA